MNYTNETFVFSAKDEVSATLKSVTIAAENAGVAVSAFGKELAESSAPRSEKELKALKTELREVDAAAGGAAKKVGGLSSKLKDGSEFWANFTIAAKGFLSVVGKIGAALAEPFRQAFRFEDVATRLAPLVGGLDKSRKLAEKLRNEAANGTESFEKLASVAGRLATVFKSTAEIERWTTAFHNLAAGTGMDVNELVGNFVKSKASGRFEAGFMDMFAQKGVNIFEPLVAQTGLASAELRKLASTGQLAFSDVEQAILACATGTGKFANSASEMSNNAGGSVSTLVAQWEILQAKFAEPIAEAITPLLQKISADFVKIQPLISGAGKVVARAANHWSASLGAAATVAALVNKRFRVLAVQKFTWLITQIRQIPAALASAKSATIAFGTTFKSVMVGVKAAMISTGIGAVVAAIGEALGFLYSKLTETDEAADSAKDTLSELSQSTEDLKNRFEDAAVAGSIDDLNRQIKRERDAWKERIEAFEEDSEEYKDLSEKFEAWKKEAARQGERAAEKIEEQRLERSRAAYREERRQMAERSNAILKEVHKLEDALKLEAASGKTKISVLLEIARVGSLDDLNAQLDALYRANFLTEGQAARARELLDVRRQIAAVEKEAESVRAGLREKIELLRAELQSNEALLALKEKLRRAELREQFTKALPGATPEQIESQLEKYIALETAVENKRRAEQAEKAVQEELIELERKRLQSLGNDAELKAFNAKIAAQKKYNALLEKGVEATKALAIANSHLSFDAGEKLSSEPPRQLSSLDSQLSFSPEANQLALSTLSSQLFAGAKGAAESSLTAAAVRTADNTGQILLELRKKQSAVPAPVLA